MHKLLLTNSFVNVNISEIIFMVLTLRLVNANIILLSKIKYSGGACICL